MAGESIEYELLAALLVPLRDALRCTPGGAPAETRVTIGNAEDACCDSLVAAVTEVLTHPLGASPEEAQVLGVNNMTHDVGLTIRATITLVRPCWPTRSYRDGDGTEVTEDQSVNEATEQATAGALIDGRVLHAALLHALADQDATFDGLYGSPDLAWTIGSRAPVRVVGCVGWAIPVTLEVGAFCAWEACVPDEPDDPGDGPTLTPLPGAAPLGSLDVRPAWMA